MAKMAHPQTSWPSAAAAICRRHHNAIVIGISLSIGSVAKNINGSSMA